MKAKEDEFLILRFYGPRSPLVDGSYNMPKMEKGK
jgi:hypothetical protein